MEVFVGHCVNFGCSLSDTGSHWKLLNRGGTRSNLWFNILLATMLRDRLKKEARVEAGIPTGKLSNHPDLRE